MQYERLLSFSPDSNNYNIYLALWDNNKETAPTDIRRGCFVIVIV